MIKENKFNESISKFDLMEKRGSFYKMAIDLLNRNFEMEAYFLILATWNFAVFRYALKDFDINDFREKIKELNLYFEKLKIEDFRTINFEKYREDIKKIYDTISSIGGVKYTGASKIMHLKNRNVFVMWDGYIKGNKPMRYYNKLEIVKNGDLEVKKYKNDAADYIQFLKDMQKTFKYINFRNDKKSFAKAVDEFNYVNITLPIQEMEKKEKQEKKNKRNQVSNGV